MKKSAIGWMVFSTAFIAMLLCNVPTYPQEDAPIFTDKDLEKYRGDENDMTSTETKSPDTGTASKYSTYEHYLKGNILDPNWLTITDIKYTPKVISGPSKKITPKYEVFGTWNFTARTPADTPQGKTFKVRYSIVFYGAGGAISYAGTNEFYLGSGNFEEQTKTPDGILGTYSRVVTHYEDFRTDEYNSSTWKIVVDSIEVM
jgi:hypothetical protein